MKSQKIGEILVGNGIISNEQLEQALEIQNQKGGLLGMILVEMHYITTEELTLCLKLQNKH